MKYVVFLIIMTVQVVAQAQQSVPSMATIGAELDESQSLPLANQISFDFITSNVDDVVKQLADWPSVKIIDTDNHSVRIVMEPQPHYTGAVIDSYTRSSFVIDTDEESVKEFVSGFARKGESLTLEELEAYTNDYINKPTYVHGFNIASVVAKQQSGDCTEHAVLITALARSLGFPSRVTIGTVLVEETQRVSAFGHAWSEIWFNNKWQVIDAALYGSEAKQQFYLPLGKLENEGPGFTLSLFSVVGRLPTKINNIKNFRN